MIRFGLAEPAMKLVIGLRQAQQRADEQLLQLFESQTAAMGRLLRSCENILVRNDGVVGVSVDLE